MNHIIYHEMLSHSHNPKPGLFDVQVSAPPISPCHGKPIHGQTCLNSPWAQLNTVSFTSFTGTDSLPPCPPS